LTGSETAGPGPSPPTPAQPPGPKPPSGPGAPFCSALVILTVTEVETDLPSALAVTSPTPAAWPLGTNVPPAWKLPSSARSMESCAATATPACLTTKDTVG